MQQPNMPIDPPNMPIDPQATTFAIDELSLEELDQKLEALGVPEAARKEIVAAEKQRRLQ